MSPQMLQDFIGFLQLLKASTPRFRGGEASWRFGRDGGETPETLMEGFLNDAT